MSSEAKDQQQGGVLNSFELEVEKYKPKDMIDFSIEYFKSLQENTPLDYKDLSGLEEFELKPTDEEVIARLQIPIEDLLRITNRRKIQTEEDKLTKLEQDIITQSKIDPSNEKDLHYYLKFKKNSYRDIEFLRFIENLENVNIGEEHNRIYFTKIFNLTPKEKKLVFDFLGNDINLLKNQKLKDWKSTLERLENSQKHCYYQYDKVSYKLKKMCDLIDENKQIDKIEYEELSKENNFNEYIEKMSNLKTEEEIYAELIQHPQFERLIIYSVIKIQYYAFNNQNIADLYKNIDNIFNKNFEYLTKFDFYDYVLICFIPLIKKSKKTSIEHREMESFLNKFLLNIPKIININFFEEKKLFYDIEMVKYFLNKENKIYKSKQILLDIIKMFCNYVKYVTETMKINIKYLKFEYDSINLKLNEFYQTIVNFVNKLVSISSKYELDDTNDMIKSIISEYKGYDKIDQNLINATLKLNQLFEDDRDTYNRLENLHNFLKKSLSILEETNEIKATNNKEIISKFALNYYNNTIKEPKYNFNNLHYIDLRAQSEVIALIIRNNLNISNIAKIYENENITPFLNYYSLIDEMFNFSNMYLKLKFDKDMKKQLDTDYEKILNKFVKSFIEENNFINNDPQNVEIFKNFKNFQQKIILTFMNLSDNYNLSSKYTNIIQELSYIYLYNKIKYVRDKIINENDLKNNQLYLEFIYKELKYVNYKIFIYLKYDKSNDLLSKFTDQEREIILLILQAENCKGDYKLPDVIGFDKLCAEENLEIIQGQLDKFYPLMNKYISEYNLDDKDDMKNCFEIFNKDERNLIMHYLEKKGKDISILKECKTTVIDLGYFTMKKIIKSLSDPNIKDDIKVYYNKLLLENEKLLSGTKSNFISCILDYPYDPNNDFLYKNFVSFYPEEKIIILQDIFCRMKILGIYTYYYDHLVYLFKDEIIENLIKIAKKHNKDEIYLKYIKEEFLYSMNFLKAKLLRFIKELVYADTQTLLTFTSEFSDKEREMICKFLELFSLIKDDDKYLGTKAKLEEYLEDLTYNERIEDIQNNLDKLIKHESNRTLFIIICENLKESCKEIDYLLEKISEKCEVPNPTEGKENLNQEQNALNANGCDDEFLFMIYKSLPTDLKEIIIKIIIVINEGNYNAKLDSYKEKFESMKNEEGTNLFGIILNSFNKIKNQILLAEDKEKIKLKESYEKLKITLDGFCGDLFNFCNNCSNGDISLRKLKALSQDKIKIIKVILECDFAIYKKKNSKKSLDIINEIKL